MAFNKPGELRESLYALSKLSKAECGLCIHFLPNHAEANSEDTTACSNCPLRFLSYWNKLVFSEQALSPNWLCVAFARPYLCSPSSSTHLHNKFFLPFLKISQKKQAAQVRASGDKGGRVVKDRETTVCSRLCQTYPCQIIIEPDIKNGRVGKED